MKNINDISLVIYARLDSQRCPKKIIRPFANSTLLDIGIQKVLKSKILPHENIYVGVYEQELINVVKKYKIKVFKRSKKSANSEGSPITEYYEFWNKIPFKYVIMFNVCHVLLNIKTIDKFIDTYRKTKSKGLFGVIEKKNYIWNKNKNLITKAPKKKSTMNTKYLDVIYEAAHCLYAGKLSDIGKEIWMGTYKKNDPQLFAVPEEESFDIDFEWQFKVAEILYKNKYGLN